MECRATLLARVPARGTPTIQRWQPRLGDDEGSATLCIVGDDAHSSMVGAPLAGALGYHTAVAPTFLAKGVTHANATYPP